MTRFLTHEVLAANLFNDQHHTAQGGLAPWKSALTNNEQLLIQLLVRMEKDWVATAAKSRKPWNLKDIDSGTEAS